MYIIVGPEWCVTGSVLILGRPFILVLVHKYIVSIGR